MIILVLGLPGTGKTYFARAFSKHLGVPHFNTDLTRNELKKRGQYEEGNKEEVYIELSKRVEKSLEIQSSVIVDATFSKKSNRDLFRELAVKLNMQIVFIEIIAEETCIKKRIKKPRGDSEADFEVYKKIMAEYEPIDNDRLVLQSDKMTLDEMMARAKIYLHN